MYYLAFVSILVATLGVSAVFRWKARQAKPGISRKSESTATQCLRLVGTLPVLVVLGLYIVAPNSLTRFELVLYEPLRVLGILGGAFGIVALWWVFRSIGSNVSETVLTKPNHELITSGPYRLLRHPLYTFGLLQLLSLGLISQNLILMIYCVVGGVVFRLAVIPREEAFLTEAFGDRYLEYKRSTWAMIPWIT